MFGKFLGGICGRITLQEFPIQIFDNVSGELFGRTLDKIFDETLCGILGKNTKGIHGGIAEGYFRSLRVTP